MTTKTREARDILTILLELGETRDVTTVEARVAVRGTGFAGRGVARRNPADPAVPQIGEELATARALADLARKLADAAEQAIEAREGNATALSL